MIRRRLGDSFRLIRQTDHAALSGQLAAALRQTMPESAVLGIGWHDAGWTERDEALPLSDNDVPADVFETPLGAGLKVWQASAERAAERDTYAGLLVSLHSTALAGHGVRPEHSRRTRFEWLTFTTRMAELQAQWRATLGLRVDRPTHGGLSFGWTDERESALRNEFQWLQALDKLSLNACCTSPPFALIEVGPDLVLRVERPGDADVRVGPWVFAEQALEFEVPYRAIAAKRYDAAELRTAVASAPVEIMRFTFRPMR